MSRIGMLAVVVVGTLVAFGVPGHAPATGGGKEQKPGAGKDEAGWKSLFDGMSLEGWKTAKFLLSGKVHVKDGAIVMETGDPMTGATYDRADFPKIDYEVAFEGKKVAGNDFFCTATFPVGESFCSLVVGGWGGRVVGLSSVNGMDASENDTRLEKGFEADRWYRFRIRVTAKRIQAWIDAERVVDLDSEGRKITTRIECIPSRPFGFATWNTAGAVRNIRVRPLSDAEKRDTGAEKSKKP